MKARRSFVFSLVLVAAVAAVYTSSFKGAFVLDDHGRIVENPFVRNPRHAAATVSHHYVAELTFAFDYARGGLNPAYYHLTNLLIHLSCVLVFFSLVRALAVSAGKPEGRAEWLAFISALLWGVHPLATSAVTYICQRYESLMSLFYLLAMLFLVKGSAKAGRHRPCWLCLSILACLGGMFTKQVMITAPLSLMLLDSSLLAGSLRKAMRIRWPYYAALLCCWAIQLTFMRMHETHAAIFEVYTAKMGLVLRTMNQGPVLLHYLRLVFWPHPLTLDYAWQPVLAFNELWLPAAIVAGLFAAVVYGFVRWPRGFLSAMCAFIILSPTSSFVPIPDLAYEHRMYLPLACIILSLVLAGEKVLRKAAWDHVAVILALLAATVLGAVAFERNKDYADPEALWGEIAERIPHNFRAWVFHVGEKLERGDYRGAERAARKMLARVAIASADDPPHHNTPSSSPIMYDAFGRVLLGRALMGQERTREALEQFEHVVNKHPDDVAARHNKALALLSSGFRIEAEREIDLVLELNQGHLQAGMIKANMLIETGRHRDAASVFEALLSTAPGLTAAKVEYAWLLSSSHDATVRDAARAVRLLNEAEAEIGATSARLFDVRAATFAEMGDFERAREFQEKALDDARKHFSREDSRILEMERRLKLYRAKKAFRLSSGSGDDEGDD